MKIMIYVFLVLVSTFSMCQTIPTSHWVYDSIRKMQILGHFQDLPKGSTPYSRVDIAIGLIDAMSITNDSLVIEHAEIGRLKREFATEIENQRQENIIIPSEYYSSSLGFSSTSQSSQNHQFALSARINLTFEPIVELQYGAILDEDLQSDPDYIGYKWRGLTGYQDQIYILVKAQNTKVLFGREYVKWGYGHSGRLFISDNSRPFDMFKLQVSGNRVQFETLIAQLDPMFEAERYLTATRVAFNPLPLLSISLGQSAIYGGKNRSLDFTLSNPLAFYSFSQDNDQKYVNAMIYADFYINLTPIFNIYGEFLVDDYQIDRDSPSDLEPNEIAFMIGWEGIGIFSLMDIWTEFTQVRNRTYNVHEGRNYEKFLHRGISIAHPKGTDFQLFSLTIENWFQQNMRASFMLSHLRKGEGTILGSFTEPWMEDEVDLVTGYNEKIPFGIVEISTDLSCGIIWHPNNYLRLDAIVGYKRIQNIDHLLGSAHNETFVQLEIVSAFNRLKTISW
jgi:hypothetical protein